MGTQVSSIGLTPAQQTSVQQAVNTNQGGAEAYAGGKNGTIAPASQTQLQAIAKGSGYSGAPITSTGLTIPATSLSTATQIQLPKTPATANPGNLAETNNNALAGNSFMQSLGFSADGKGGFTYAQPTTEAAGASTTSTAGTGTSSMENIFAQYLGMKQANAPQSKADEYTSEYNASGIADSKQAVQNYTTTLNGIVAKSQADSLSVVGQGKGIPGAILNNQQAAIQRNAAIAALPVQAQLAAAQGNLQLAQDHLDTMFKLKSEDIDNQFKYKNDLYDAVFNFATKEEQQRLDQKKIDDQRAYDDKKTNLSLINDWSKTAVQTGQSDLVSKFAALDPASPTFTADFGKLTAQVKDPNVALDTQYKEAQINSLNYKSGTGGGTGSNGGSGSGTTTSTGFTPTATNFWAEAAASGVNTNSLLPSLGMGAAAVATKTALLNKIADNAQILGIDGATFGALLTDSRAKQSTYSQLQKQGSALQVSEQKTLSDFNLLKQAGAKMDANSWNVAIPALNSWLRTGQVATTGNADVNNYLGLLTTSLTNYAKVVNSQTSSSGVTVSANGEVQNLIGKGLSTASVNSYIDNVATPEMHNTTSSYDSALKGLFGNIKDVQSGSNTGGLGGTTDSQMVDSAVKSAGFADYQTAINAVPVGKIGVVDKSSGQLGYIEPSEFDGSKYTKI